MVHRQLADAEPQFPHRGAQPLHRRPRLDASPKYHEHWDKLEELKKTGFFNDDVASQELYQGIQLFDTGKASMCFNTGPALPNSQKKLGADKVGFMVMPVFGRGSLAGMPISDSQGFGIPSKGKNHEQAAKLLEFMHSPEQVEAMWTISKQIPADTTSTRHDRRPAAQDGARQVDRGRPRASTSPT